MALAVAVALVLAAAALFTGGSGVQNFSAGDTAYWLNSGWRIAHGQVPHRDFTLTTGTTVAYLAAAGQALRGATVGSIAAGQAVAGLLLGGAAFLVLRRRTTPLLTAVGALCCALLVMATRQPGEWPHLHSHAFLYNRLAEALLALLVWITTVRPVTAHRIGDALESAGAGALLALLFLTKISYGLVGAGWIGLTVVLGLLPVRHWLPLAAGFFASATFAAQAFGLAWWWADVSAPFRTGFDGVLVPRLPAAAIKNAPALLAFAALLGLAWKRMVNRPWRMALLALAAWGVATLSAASTQQRQEYALCGTVLIALAALLTQRSFAATRGWTRALLVLALLYNAPRMALDAASLAGSWMQRHETTVPDARVDAGPLADFRLAPNNAGYAELLNDGLTLLRAHTKADDRVMTIDWSDPFAFALQRPPPKGGAVLWANGFSFNDTTGPDAARIFRGVPWVLVRRDPLYEPPFTTLYRERLAADYVLAAESAHFRLWRPRPSP